MKYIAWFLVLVTIVALGGLAFFWQGAQLEVLEVSVQVHNAGDQKQSYDSLLAALEEGSFTGTVYKNEAFLIASTYEFVTYSVRLRNNGLLPAEWIQIKILPEGGDVLAYHDGRGYSLASLSIGTLSATQLSYAGAERGRTAIISYYVWGRLFEVQATVQ